MPPFWPFKKKQEVAQVYEAPPAPTVYRRGEDPHVRPSVTNDVAAYKDALALFGGGSEEVNAATDQSVLYDGATGETNASPKASPAEVAARRQPTPGCITPMDTTTNEWRTAPSIPLHIRNVRTEPTHRIPDRTTAEWVESVPDGLRSPC